MNFSPLWILLAILTFSHVIPFVMALLATLRQPVFQIKISRITQPPLLSKLHQAAVDELVAIGFRPFTAFAFQEGPDTVEGLMLRHETFPAFADLYFRASPLAAYPVIFYSFAENDMILMTTNRQPSCLEYPKIHQIEAFAESLPLHWQAHENRMKNAKLLELDNESAYARIAKFYDDYLPYHVQKKVFVNRSGSWFLSFPMAFQAVMNAMSFRKKIRKPYQTILTSDPYQSSYYAERYQAMENLKKRAKYRIDIAAISLIASLIVSSALLGWFWGWQSAIAIIAVLLVHELGHAVAMFIFGYRDMNMFFVPFLGAFVSGNAKNISVWKQSIILLAGPLPGLIFGTWAVIHTYHQPGFDFFSHLGYVAVVINLFNLLPLSFLDGGKLLEIGLFMRWPYAAFAFSLLSCLGLTAFAFYSSSYNLLAITFLMTVALKSTWRIAHVRHLEKENTDKNGNLKELFELVRQKFGNLSFSSQYRVVRAVYEPPHVRPPRIWETVLTLSLFTLIWLPVLVAIFYKWGNTVHPH